MSKSCPRYYFTENLSIHWGFGVFKGLNGTVSGPGSVGGCANEQDQPLKKNA